MTVTRFSQASLSVPTKYRNLMAGSATLGDYELISTTVLGSSAASVTFSGLGTSAAAYKHLQIRAVARDPVTIYGGTYMGMQFNGDTANNYAHHRLAGDGGAPWAGSNTSTSRIFAGRLAGSAASNTTAYSTHIIDILDFASTSKNKTSRTLNGALPDTQVMLLSGVWMSTSAITSILLNSVDGGNFAAGSRFSLYGLR